jgi:hypothetical protein
MLINIFMGNHDLLGASSLEDQCLAFQGALRDLGHDTFLSYSMVAPPIVNLVFDNFVEPHTAFIRDHLANHRIGVICTERFEGSVLNVPGLAAERARNLLEIGRACAFLWCLDPIAARHLQEALPGCPVFHTPVGYVKQLENIEPIEPARKIWDLCFTGTLTPYRQELLSGLVARGLGVAAAFFPNAVRRSVMARARLQLTLKQTADSFMPSQMRIAYCLANGFPVVSDFGGVAPESPIEAFCFNVRREELAEQCAELLRNPAAQAEAQGRVRRFKTTYRMADLIADTVRRSLA